MTASLKLINRLDANRRLLEIVTSADITAMRVHCDDDSDVVGALLQILYDAETDDPEQLLEDCGIFFKEEADEAAEDEPEKRLEQ